MLVCIILIRKDSHNEYITRIEHYYRPQMKFGKLCFYTCLPVILFTGGSVSVHAGMVVPQEQTPPWADTPQGQIPHPLGADPPEQTPRAADPPRSRHTPPGADTPPRTVYAGRYGQQAGGIHPTGMPFNSNETFVTLFHINISRNWQYKDVCNKIMNIYCPQQ